LTRSRLKIILLTGVMVAQVSPANAETLRDALMSAYETNPTLTGARAGQQATNEEVPIAKADGRPNLAIVGNYLENVRTSANSFTAPSRLTSNDATLTVPIYSGGRVRNSVKAAETRVNAGFANLRGAESSIFSQTVGAYMDVIRDEAVVELNRAQVGVLAVNLEATKDRFEIGDLTRTDVAQSEARFSAALGNMENARANLIRSKEVYIQIVGKEPGMLEAPPPLPGLPADPDAAVAIALDQNPDLISAKKNVDAASYARKAANASRLPTLSAFAQGNYSNFFNTLGGNIPGTNFVQSTTTASLGLRANIPLYQGGRPAAQIRQAQARVGQAQEQQIATERGVIAQTRAAYASWKASLELIASSERGVAANELSLEGVRAENSVGNRTILDILNAEQELLNSKVNLVTARRNAYVAGFTLLAAMGKAEARDLGLENGTLYDPVAEYEKIDKAWNDWSTKPDPKVQSTRTIDTSAQKAEIVPLPDYSKGYPGRK